MYINTFLQCASAKGTAAAVSSSLLNLKDLEEWVKASRYNILDSKYIY